MRFVSQLNKVALTYRAPTKDPEQKPSYIIFQDRLPVNRESKKSPPLSWLYIYETA